MLSPKKINAFLFFKLPAAWWCGVRLKKINTTTAVVTVTHRWINQNPFRSMYFAVQSMAAELSTGALVMQHIRANRKNISMLVIKNKAEFFKKATGKITFRCEEGEKISDAIQKTIETQEGQTCWVKSIGRNEENIVVAEFLFEWTLKVK